MRKRFNTETTLGQKIVKDIYVNPKSKNAVDQLVAALKEIYCNEEYNEKIFNAIERHLPPVDCNNGRPGMNLWTIFVLGQLRMSLGFSYEMVHNQANNHMLLRQLLGIDDVFGNVSFEYQTIYDNVSLLSDDMLREINDIIVEFGHKEVFKKKETEDLLLKSDSFVVESNVHFPSDYSLLFDCCRKSLDTVTYFLRKYPQITGWRKLKNWNGELKSLCRSVGRASKSGGKNKQENLKRVTTLYLDKCRLLLTKLVSEKKYLPILTQSDLIKYYELDNYIELLIKHIDLLDRRVLKGETIAHTEKMMSIFETYTEWIVKGKTRPSVELGKKISITSDQFGLILYHKVMDHEQDRDIVVEIADNLLSKYKSIFSLSLDKGHWNAENKSLLELEIPMVVLPKLGKRNASEKLIEDGKLFKHLKNKHSAVESNINELEHRGLNRCPDRSYQHFKNYVAMGICAYNLKKIGKKILENQLKELLRKKVA